MALFGQYKDMKGFLGVMSILSIIGIITLFGGAWLDLTATGARCALGVSGVGNYTCNELGHVAGSTIILPDRNIKLGVESITAMRRMDIAAVRESGMFDNDTMQGMESLYQSKESGFRMQIIMGIAGLIMIILLLVMFFYKVTPGSKIDAGSAGMCILGAFLVICVIHIAFTGLVEGRAEMPFTGVITLLFNADVMWDVVDESAVLPGTMTSDDILEGES